MERDDIVFHDDAVKKTDRTIEEIEEAIQRDKEEIEEMKEWQRS